MAQSLELRTIFADSTWATRNDDGSFSINLSEQMEVAPEHVLFLDNISVCGNLPQISLHNRNLYIMERVPKRFEYANVQIKAGEHHPHPSDCSQCWGARAHPIQISDRTQSHGAPAAMVSGRHGVHVCGEAVDWQDGCYLQLFRPL